MTLHLERRDQENTTPVIGGIMLTPNVGGDYWAYRVMVSEKQAIIGFPKFVTIGIGFAVEEDWNTNLPYTCDTEEIWQHISHNKGDDAIVDDDCREAIRLVREAVIADRAPKAEPAAEERQTYVTELSALDRCEHGRHVADNCGSCPGRWSTGNLYLTPGQRIGTTLYGDPIIAPEHDQRGHSENWVEGEGRRIK